MVAVALIGFSEAKPNPSLPLWIAVTNQSQAQTSAYWAQTGPSLSADSGVSGSGAAWDFASSRLYHTMSTLSQPEGSKSTAPTSDHKEGHHHPAETISPVRNDSKNESSSHDREDQASAAAAATTAINQQAFSRNAVLPNVDTTLANAALAHRPSTQHNRTASAGLQIMTDLQPPAATVHEPIQNNTTRTDQPPLEGSSLQPNYTSPSKVPITGLGSSLRSSASMVSSTSPGSAFTSPFLSAMADITPLPSPLVVSGESPGPWRKMRQGTPGSRQSSIDSTHSTDRNVSQPTSPVSPTRKKKGYGSLMSAAIETSMANAGIVQEPGQMHARQHSRQRSISDFVPEQLTNARQRHVTIGPGDASTMGNQGYQMQREEYVAAQRGLAVPSPPLQQSDTSMMLPTPPPSTASVAESDEADEDKPPLDEQGVPTEYLHIHCGINQRKRKFRPLRQLGQGTFSRVILATTEKLPNRPASDVETRINPHKLVAVKIVEHGPAGGADEERIETSLKREVDMLKSVSHPSLIHLKACEYQHSQALIVLTYCPGGDLFDLASQRRDVLTPINIQRMFAELTSAVRYLHSHWIVHRDIKLENVLVNVSADALHSLDAPLSHQTPLVTLTDLGLSRRIPEPPESPLLQTRCGSEDYAAPEILLGQPYDGRQTDAWALGVLLYALMEGRLPFDAPPGKPDRSRNTFRIARCDWIWCRFGDEDGDWSAEKPGAAEYDGARLCVEALLKKVRMGRKPLEEVENMAWVRQGIQVPGGLQIREEDLDDEWRAKSRHDLRCLLFCNKENTSLVSDLCQHSHWDWGYTTGDFVLRYQGAFKHLLGYLPIRAALYVLYNVQNVLLFCGIISITLHPPGYFREDSNTKHGVTFAYLPESSVCGSNARPPLGHRIQNLIYFLRRTLSQQQDALIDAKRDKGKATVQIVNPAHPTGRTYNGPLSLVPSGKPVRNAQILGRTDPDARNHFTSTYTVRVGKVKIGDIGIHEITDYASALEVERFEHERFDVEREVREAEEAADEEAERLKMLAKKARVGRPKGVAGYRVPGEVDEEREDGATVAQGREGRARPSYKHLYRAARHRRRRRRRDLVTGNLIPLSDEEEEGEDTDEDNDDVQQQATSMSTSTLPDSMQSTNTLDFPVMLGQPRRRRRKRDPVTGELMPLSPLQEDTDATTNLPIIVPSKPTASLSIQQQSTDSKKRQRRRRHPITGVLMPLGWVYDPTIDDPSASYGTHKSSSRYNVNSLERLSITGEPITKRPRLESESDSASKRSRSPVIKTRSSPVISGNASPRIIAAALQSLDEGADDVPDTIMSEPNSTFREAVGALESESESETDENLLQSFKKPLPSIKPKTSIMNPTANIDVHDISSSSEAGSVNSIIPSPAKTSIIHPAAALPVVDDDDESSKNENESELGEGEFEIEKILAHHLSDPRTHPKELGKVPVMLYKVKWVGWDEPTWEPAESFDDRELVDEYHRVVAAARPSGQLADIILTSR
ncbi:hypothetical protein K431DRAFT_294465 [Polychaeton citri CBS 116435]|uniref:non-specific serine/threonine protein kinase n=1 Tax=Polychaeton citri CBS 116435 TaxID=1314669 RepID=A0A9P4UQ75_9PEZI|nr:hypothetical protein K431DRAFT_294465 [Polychaeton citri CBS 116435]